MNKSHGCGRELRALCVVLWSVLFSVFLVSCAQTSQVSYASINKNLRQGMILPKGSGIVPEPDSFVVFGIYQGGVATHFVMDKMMPDGLRQVDTEALPSGKVFLVYMDAREHWSALIDVYRSVRENNSNGFFVAVEDGDDPAYGGFEEASFKPRNKHDATPLIYLKKGGTVDLTHFSETKHFSNINDPRFHSALLEASKNSKLLDFYITGCDETSVGHFLSAIGVIRYHTRIVPYVAPSD